MLKLSDIRELLLKLDRRLKTGVFTFSLLTGDKKDRAVMHELVLDYGLDEQGRPYGADNGFPVDKNGKVELPRPKLYVVDENGNRVDIQSEAAIRIKDFMDNFFEVSVTRTKYGEPSMWLKLIPDANGNTTYNNTNIEEFYRYLQFNKENLTPHIMQTFKDGERHILMPFVTADHVFYDVSKIIAGEGIRNFEDTFELLHNLIKNITDNISDNLRIIEDRMNRTFAMLTEKSNVHDRAIESLETSITRLDGSLREINKKADSLSDKIGKTFSRKSVHVKAGQILKIIFNPLKHGFKPAIDSYEKGADIFSSSIFITGEIGFSEVFVDIGVGSHIGIDRLAFYMDKNTSPRLSQPNMRIAQVGAPMSDNIISFAEQMKIGEYVFQFNYDIDINIWSKYVDYMEVITAVSPQEMVSILRTVQKNKSRLNDLGMLPIKNSVISRTSTTFLTRGFALSDDTIVLAGGHRWNDLEGFGYTSVPDPHTLSGAKDYAPPKEKLFIHTTSIMYSPFKTTMSMSCGYFRPGMSIDFILYDRTNQSTPIGVYKTETKHSLSAEELNNGYMYFSFTTELPTVEEGDPYGIIVSAPNFITSDEIPGTIRLNRHK